MTLLEFPQLLIRVRDKRLKHYSVPTERAYVGWIKRFIRYYRKRTLPIGTGSGRITPGLTRDRFLGCSVDAEPSEEREQIRAYGGRATVCSTRKFHRRRGNGSPLCEARPWHMLKSQVRYLRADDRFASSASCISARFS
jgi:hypothetical protein